MRNFLVEWYSSIYQAMSLKSPSTKNRCIINQNTERVYFFLSSIDLTLPEDYKTTTMSRPELTGHASLFYNAKEARKYDSSSRMIGVQREITERAIELLRLPDDKPSFVLDIGCGSGLSGQVLEERGHVWVGCDVSRDMLEVANERITRKRESGIEDVGMDESDEDEEEDDSPSSGDLMHHVSM